MLEFFSSLGFYDSVNILAYLWCWLCFEAGLDVQLKLFCSFLRMTMSSITFSSEWKVPFSDLLTYKARPATCQGVGK